MENKERARPVLVSFLIWALTYAPLVGSANLGHVIAQTRQEAGVAQDLWMSFLLISGCVLLATPLCFIIGRYFKELDE